MKRLVILFLLLIFSVNLLAFPCNPQVVATSTDGTTFDDFRNNLGDLFSAPTGGINEQVYLGGYPLGLTIDGEGVTVVGLNEFVGSDGKLSCPALKCGLQVGDVVIELDGQKIFSSARLVEVATASKGKNISIKFIRDGSIQTKQIAPCKDLTTGSFRLGLWTRDASSGVGTLTYVRKNLTFASLGHPICDAKGKIVNCTNGGVFNCQIDGVKRGEVGCAGELKGTLMYENHLGSLYKNNKFGAYGTFSVLPSFCDTLIDVADIGEVKPGSAKIYCTLDNDGCKSYDIKIVKTNFQTSRDDKGMVLLVTDPALLEKTGGIVQGMSGSPIVQNGKLVGAVTHVFVNDPTRGYGIYAKWMLTN